MSIKAGTGDGFMDSIGTDSLDSLFTPPARLDKGMGGLIMGVDMGEIFGMRVEDKYGSPPPNSTRSAGHMGGCRPYNTIPFIGSYVLDFRKHAFGRIYFLDSYDIGIGADTVSYTHLTLPTILLV